VRAFVPALLAAVALAGCTGPWRGRWRAIPNLPEAVVDAAVARVEPFPDQIAGTPPVRVVWEALAGEAEQIKNPRWGDPAGTAFRLRRAPELKIVLLNASHPEAFKMRLRALESRSQRFEAEIAIVSDEDMNLLLQGFEQMGVFRYARPTSALETLFKSERARGRITIDRGGESVTLLSQYGLGLQEATRAIPGVYRDAKSAVAILKNRTPGLSVIQFRAASPRAADSR
jgi:hypothetical protein